MKRDPGNFPTHLDLELTNKCNFSCKMCFKSMNPEKIMPFGFMDIDLAKKIIDEGSKKGLKSIKFIYRGESLLHPGVVEIVKYAMDHGIVDTLINTNVSLLTDTTFTKLVCLSGQAYALAILDNISLFK